MPMIELSLGPYRSAVERTLTGIAEARVVQRIHDMDHTVWKDSPAQITDRLGWLFSPANMRQRVHDLSAFAEEVRSAGYTRALLLGMGGSSLAPEVLSTTFGAREGFLGLGVLDSTDPSTVASLAGDIDPSRTLFIVSTKSGTTVETLSLFKYFYGRTAAVLGREEAGEHFVAITDPGNPLNETALRCAFRKVFAGEPTIGGRFSALSVFGLVPGALLGIDAARLLERAIAMADSCRQADVSLLGANDGAKLGTALGVLSLAGRNKLTFFLPQRISGFGDWAEQLVAESTGKEGRGIVPVIAEAPGSVDVYGTDRVFVCPILNGEEPPMPDLSRLGEAGHPVIRIFLDDVHDIGAQFFLWEFATAVAGHVLSLNPFDQPDVEATKSHTRAAVDAFLRTGRLQTGEPLLTDQGISVFGGMEAPTLRDALIAFLLKAREDSYVSFQAYLPPEPPVRKALDGLRILVRDRYRVATTLGFGPRFLHSTGQLHKGDAGQGLFVQITCTDPRDLAIPDEPGHDRSTMSFGVLKAAQAIGDAQALTASGRRIVRLHIHGPDIAASIDTIVRALA